MEKDLVMDDIEPVFIVGNPRSGTTFLQLLISAHSNFSSGPETHLFQYILDPPVSDWKRSKLNLNDMDVIFKRFADKPAIVFNREFKENIKIKVIKDGIATASFLNEIMIYFAKTNNDEEANRWVEKTPRHILYVPEIITMFPKGKIINIIRDPRSVISSKYSSTKNKLLRFKLIIRDTEQWSRMVEFGMKMNAKYKNNLLSVYYEDIINNPGTVLEKIMRFLDEKIEIDVLKTFSKNYKKVVREFEHNYKCLCEEKEIIDRRDIWKARMQNNDIKLVEIICEKLMKKHGYEIEHIKNLSAIEKEIWIFYKKIIISIRFLPHKLVTKYKILSILRDSLFKFSIRLKKVSK